MAAIPRIISDRIPGNLFYGLLKYMGLRIKFDPRFRRQVKSNGDAFSARIQIETKDQAVNLYSIFDRGKMRTRKGRIGSPDLTLRFQNPQILMRILTEKDTAVFMNLLLKNEIQFDGNLSYASRFFYLVNCLTARNGKGKPDRFSESPRGELPLPKMRGLSLPRVDAVKYLKDPALASFGLEDFPRLRAFRDDFFNVPPEICTERPRLLTRFFRAHGFETDPAGKPIDPELRQGRAINYVLTHKQPLIRANDLIAGTTTSKPIGVVIYPECGGTALWPELQTLPYRALNPYRIAKEDADILNFEVFPYWMERNVREYARTKFNHPRSQQLDERFVLYFMWKTQAVSHTIPNFPAVLSRGLRDIAREARERIEQAPDQKAKNLYLAMALSLEGAMKYTENLSARARELAQGPEGADPVRKAELLELSRICAQVPAGPSETLAEAVNAVWITWLCLHQENTNAGFSLGRLDKWLNPFFLKEMAQARDEAERGEIIKRSIELLGCLFLRVTDHLPMVPDVGNYLFAGSSSDQALTIGGVNEDGSNAVTDMTYIILKVAEMLCLRDPNLNARYHPEVNSREYLRRLCEVNWITGSTPSIHNDRAMIASLENQGFAPEHARDWCATGCVEPTSAGRHYGHTNCMLLNLVAPLEMTFYNGVHPLIQEKIGPETGEITGPNFRSFESFRDTYYRQLRYLIDQSVECNNLLGESHKFIRPTPFLSALIDGPMEKGKDLIEGGAMYNSSGSALVALSDVVDSLMAIKKLVYEEKRVDLPTLLKALEQNFVGYENLHTRIQNKIPKFGSNDPEVKEIADHLINFIYDAYQSQQNYRGGKYTSGFWSMSNHVAFGNLSGALPSGRLRFLPFTPGITPAPNPHDSFLANIQTVAELDPLKMPNNIAFNVKVVPDPRDSQAQTLDYFTAYAKSYFDLGGMQMQFNVVSTETLRDAQRHPENYRTLMVRISGYNAYFTELNKNMQGELIGRIERQLGK